MTFTIMGRCMDTGQVGIGIATTSIGVGGLCPFYTPQGHIVCSQAYARPEAGIEASKLLMAGTPFPAIMNRLAETDDFLSYRQIGMLRREGTFYAHTGDDCRHWAGHEITTDCLVMGNVLQGPEIIHAMANAFEEDKGHALSNRLIKALEAGRDAGGQADAEGRHMTERSSALRVIGTEHDPAVAAYDLRVDIHANAVDELRHIYELCYEVPGYNQLRSTDPPNTPTWAIWEKQTIGLSILPPLYYDDNGNDL